MMMWWSYEYLEQDDDYSIASQETVTESWQPFLVEGKAYYQKMIQKYF